MIGTKYLVLGQSLISCLYMSSYVVCVGEWNCRTSAAFSLGNPAQAVLIWIICYANHFTVQMAPKINFCDKEICLRELSCNSVYEAVFPTKTDLIIISISAITNNLHKKPKIITYSVIKLTGVHKPTDQIQCEHFMYEQF